MTAPKTARKTARPSVYREETIALMALIEAFVKANPVTTCAAVYPALGISKARCNKVMALMRADGVIRHTYKDERTPRWSEGADPNYVVPKRRGATPSQDRLTVYGRSHARDPWALPHDFFAAAPGYRPAEMAAA